MNRKSLALYSVAKTNFVISIPNSGNDFKNYNYVSRLGSCLSICFTFTDLVFKKSKVLNNGEVLESS